MPHIEIIVAVIFAVERLEAFQTLPMFLLHYFQDQSVILLGTYDVIFMTYALPFSPGR